MDRRAPARSLYEQHWLRAACSNVAPVGSFARKRATADRMAQAGHANGLRGASTRPCMRSLTGTAAPCSRQS